jgi:Xaa-Pro aminopeptidase/Xaa-Pro dipeptidase
LRRKRLFDIVRQDLVLVSEPIHVYYLTGLKAAIELQFDVLMKRNPIFLGMFRDGPMFLLAGRSSLANPFLTDELMFDSKRLFEGKLWTYGDYDLDERVVAQMDFVAEELSEVVAEMKSRGGRGLEEVGVEEWHLQHEVTARLSKEFPSIRFSGISGPLREMRVIKDEAEKKSIAEGISRLKFVLQGADSLVVPGKTEIGALQLLNGRMGEQYGEGAIIDGQLLSGKRTSEVFGRATRKKLEAGERAILDLHTNVGGYWARQAATIRVGSGPAMEDDLEARVRDALETGEGAFVAGVRAGDVFGRISEKLSKAGKNPGLVHEAGHGVGLELQEEPFLIPNSSRVIREGMVCVLMAGLYAGSAGVRLSDCCAVGKADLVKL